MRQSASRLLRFTPGISAPAIFIILTCRAAHADPVLVDFAQQVHPVLAARCLPCHSAEKRSGGLSLTSYEDVLEGGRNGAVVKPGKAGASLLIARITGETKPQMPLGGTPLSEAEISAVRSWIDQGARATPTSAAAKPKWEAPLVLTAPAKPAVVWKDWTSPVDVYAAAYLAKHGAAEPQLISDSTFARRAYLDIWGLLPPPAELKAFVEDHHSNKRQQLVATLLADDGAYAENWISYWNDLLRNDEGVSYYSETASRKSISDWLFAALKTNLPYDKFVRQLLNPARAADPEGFLIGVNWRGDRERQSDAGHAGSTEYGTDLSRRQPEVQLLPRQLYQQVEASRRLLDGQLLLQREQAAASSVRRAAGTVCHPGLSLSRAEPHTRFRQHCRSPFHRSRYLHRSPQWPSRPYRSESNLAAANRARDC